MRCMACGTEMILMKVIEDMTMPVPGFERHAYMCSLCNETEQRLVFNKRVEECESGTVGAPAPIVPTSMIQNLCKTANSIASLYGQTYPFYFDERRRQPVTSWPHLGSRIVSA
jgi:hypothetical protein